jgi:hypothetical protein
MHLKEINKTVKNSTVCVTVAGAEHCGFAEHIAAEMESSAKARGTGISRRSAESLRQKMLEGKAVIAVDDRNEWAGFAYLESWEDGKFVSNSGLIISPSFRNLGIASAIKQTLFSLCRSRYPDAKVFGLTTSQAVMKINSAMQYEPVIYSEITSDEKFWEGCKSCVNFHILMEKERKNCLCTAMLFDPAAQENRTKRVA